jgi:hypothetical protein
MRGIKSYWSGRCGGVSRHLLPMLLGRWLGALFVSGLILGSLLFAPTDRTEYAVSYSSMRTSSQHTLNGFN